MYIKCKVCANCNYCSADAWGCNFSVDMRRLIETAHELEASNHIEFGDALRAIDICLKNGGQI